MSTKKKLLGVVKVLLNSSEIEPSVLLEAKYLQILLERKEITPITPDVLEKNGWKYKKDRRAINGIGRYKISNDWVEFWKGKTYVNIKGHGGVLKSISEMEDVMDYVGIEKEIEL